jgi:hypothetical protein
MSANQTKIENFAANWYAGKYQNKPRAQVKLMSLNDVKQTMSPIQFNSDQDCSTFSQLNHDSSGVTTFYSDATQ